LRRKILAASASDEDRIIGAENANGKLGFAIWFPLEHTSS